MHKRLHFTIATAVLSGWLLFHSTAKAADPLSSADVQAVSGLPRIQTVPKKSQPGAGGDINFITPDKKLILMVGINEQAMYKTWKKMFFRNAVAGVGDEAFMGPQQSAQPYVIYFRKGGKAVSLSSFFDRKGKPRLTPAQLTRLAQIAASRI
jgi:hypothetical protein